MHFVEFSISIWATILRIFMLFIFGSFLKNIRTFHLHIRFVKRHRADGEPWLTGVLCILRNVCHIPPGAENLHKMQMMPAAKKPGELEKSVEDEDELPRLPLWLFVVLCDIIFIKRIIGASLAYPVSAAQRTCTTQRSHPVEKPPPNQPTIPLMQMNNGCLLFQFSSHPTPSPTPIENMLLFFSFSTVGAIFDLKVDAEWLHKERPG